MRKKVSARFDKSILLIEPKTKLINKFFSKPLPAQTQPTRPTKHWPIDSYNSNYLHHHGWFRTNVTRVRLVSIVNLFLVWSTCDVLTVFRFSKGGLVTMSRRAKRTCPILRVCVHFLSERWGPNSIRKTKLRFQKYTRVPWEIIIWEDPLRNMPS